MSKAKWSLGTQTINIVDGTALQEKPGWKIRYDNGDMKALGMNIKANGVRVPLLVHNNKGKLEVVDGGRRYKAIHNLISKGTAVRVPIVLTGRNETEKDWLISFLSTIGKPLLPYEEAIAFMRLTDDYGMEIKEVAEVLGMSQAHVKERLVLMKAVPSVVDGLKKGDISLAAVQRIVKVADMNAEKQEDLFLKELDDKGSTKVEDEVRKKEDHIKRVRLKRSAIKEQAGNRLTMRKAKVLLAEVSEKYTDLMQARLPITMNNRHWKALQKALAEVQNLKKEGVLKV